MTLISTTELAKIANVEKRQIQRILERGVIDFGATKTPGGHWEIPDTVKVRRWAKNHERWKRGGSAKKSGLNNSSGKSYDKSHAIVTIEGISHSFALWYRGMAPKMERWEGRQLDAAIALLDQQARVHAELVAKRDKLRKERSDRA
jgi:hypothetical protein